MLAIFCDVDVALLTQKISLFVRPSLPLYLLVRMCLHMIYFLWDARVTKECQEKRQEAKQDTQDSTKNPVPFSV